MESQADYSGSCMKFVIGDFMTKVSVF